MYFPIGYKKRLALELGSLVEEAYSQFASFESGSAWALPPPYRLVSELLYNVDEGQGNKREFDVLGLLGGSKKAGKGIPIGFIAEKAKRVYVIFRGTKTPKEWLGNFTVILKDYPLGGAGAVHGGFLDAYASIRSEIASGLERCGGGEAVCVAGHSLGAAMATIAVPDIACNMRRSVRAVYLFGSPRVGNSEFVKSYNFEFGKRTYRVANTSDIVTSIPLPIPMLGPVGGYFSHVDTPVDFTRQDEDIVKNHRMETYLEELRGAKEGLLRRILRGGA